MKSVRIRFHAGSSLGWPGKLLALVSGLIFLACFILLVMGLWLVLAVCVVLLLIAALVRALVPRRISVAQIDGEFSVEEKRVDAAVHTHVLPSAPRNDRID